MAKKCLCVIMFIILVICTFTSCNDDEKTTDTPTPEHIHNYGDWDTTQAPTCKSDGIKERFCTCGEKQSSAIAKIPHNFVNDICTMCDKNISGSSVSEEEKQYNEALALIESEKYEEAFSILSEIENYKDAKSMLENFKYVPDKVVQIVVDPLAGGAFVYNIHYNNDDRSVQIIRSDSDSSTTTLHFTFNEKGNVIKYAQIHSDGAESEEYVTEYAYNADGLLVQEKSQNITTYIYDQNANLIKEITMSSDGLLDHIYEYSYDNYGSITKQIYTSKGLSSTTTYKNTYDKNGNVIQTVTTFDDGKQLIHTYVYDSNGRLVRESYPDVAYSDPNTYEYLYDENGNLIEATCTDADGNIRYSTIYVYDKNNNLIKVGNEDGTTFEYKMIYFSEEWISGFLKMFMSF